MNSVSAFQARPPQKATDLHAQPSANYAEKWAHTLAVLQEAAHAYPSLTQASSLGAEDVVITHIIKHLGLNIPVFVLETGALHHETLALLERSQAHAQTPIRVFRPQPEAVLDFVREHGQEAIYQSIALRKACCQIRKMEPLARALEGHGAWITGLRREQSNNRAQVDAIDRSEARVKVNPLADWTWGDVWHCIAEHRIDYNPLHDRFFPSIGCAPCTRAISLGEEFRAGRWWWEDESAKECGLHVKA